MIDYQLPYRNLSSPVTAAHIHFGRPATAGGIVLFLCSNVGGPPVQACPNAPATIVGTLTAANILPLVNQGIDSGAAGFAEVLKAIRAHAAYVNVHTTNHPAGEIRGRLDGRDEHHDRDE